MDYAQLTAAHDHASPLCICGAAAGRCAQCRGAGWTQAWTECPPCNGIGGTRTHDIGCPARVQLIKTTTATTFAASRTFGIALARFREASSELTHKDLRNLVQQQRLRLGMSNSQTWRRTGVTSNGLVREVTIRVTPTPPAALAAKLSGMSDEIAAEQPAVMPEPPTAPPRPVKRRPTAVIAGLVGLAVGASGVGIAWGLSAVSKPAAVTKATFALTGTLTLTHGVLRSTGSCEGTGGYSGITLGAAVTVYDATGAVVGSGSLGNGSSTGAGGYGACDFQFTVSNVPDGSNFYQVEISHRGKLTVPVADAKAGRFAASLG